MSVAVLYESTEIQFNTLGLGPLREAESCLVTEERNGIFELSLDYPITGVLFKELKNTRIIKAHAGPTLRNQRFRINRVSKIFTKNGKKYVTIYAEHVSYLTIELAMLPEVHIVTLNAYEALRVWKSALLDSNPFTVHSDITTISSTNWHIREVENPRMALGGVEGSLLDIYGGEYKFDNHTISLLKQRGKKANTIIKYGRNLTDLTQDEYINTTYTSVYPYAIYTDDQQNEKLVTIDGYIVDSEHVNKYPNRKVLPIDFSSEFDQDNLPTKEKLSALAKTYIKANNVGVPRVSIKLEYIDLSQTLDYKDLAVFEEINLCDELPVYFGEMDIKTTAKVVRVVWNNITDRYETIELGETKTTLSNVISNIETNINNVQTTVNEVQLAANGKNMVFRGPDKPTAQKVGDQWYKPVGDDTELYIWNGSEWEFVMSTAPDPEIKEAIEELEKTTAKNKEEINKAVEKADQSIEEAGFAKDAADNAKSIANQATDNANQALKDALEAKEEMKEAQVQLTNINGELGQKVSQTTFNQLQGTVSQQGTAINQNKTDIALKANQSEVNTLTGRVSSAESKLTVQSGQISGLVTKTDGQATEIANLTLTANGLNSTVSKVQTELNNLDFGVRNLFSEAKTETISLANQYSFKKISDAQSSQKSQFFKTLEREVEYTLTVRGKGSEFGEMRFYIQNPNVYSFSKIVVFDSSELTTKSLTFVIPKSIDMGLGFTFGAFDMKQKGGCYLEWVVLTKGNKAVNDCILAPEDMATQVEFSNLQQTVNGIQTTVAGKADQSQTTQLSGQITSVVKIVDNIQTSANNLMINSEERLFNPYQSTTVTHQTNIVVDEWKTVGARRAYGKGGTSTVIGTLGSGQSSPRETTKKDTEYVHSVYIKNNHKSKSMIFTNNINSSIEIKAGEVTRAYLKGVGNGVQNIQINFSVKSIGDEYDFTYWHPMVSEGNVLSDWCKSAEETANQSQITQLTNMINLRVEKNQIISQINISPENILLESKLIHLSGKSKIDDAVITSAMIANAAITSAKIQDAAISNAKILNVDAGKLTSGFIDSNRIQARSITADKLTADAIQVGFNAMGNTIKISPIDLSFYSGGTMTGRLTDNGMEFWYGTRKVGYMGETFKLGNASVRGIAHNLEGTGDFITWGFKNTSIIGGGDVYTAMLTLDPKGLFSGRKGISVDQDIYLNKNIGVVGANQALTTCAKSAGGQLIPALTNQTTATGIAFSSSELYLMKNNSYIELSEVMKVVKAFSGLGRVAIATSFTNNGTAASWYNISL